MIKEHRLIRLKAELLFIEQSIATEYNQGRSTDHTINWLLSCQSRYLKLIKEVEDEETKRDA
jgi:hypothetical protein